ncbi:MAG: GTP-binding protein [Parcubacteria group bacterium Athens1014_10]|nr:MAG: GTP-binding protein [Parcubacteria group bacterium Athens1014_10]TSD04876.1 MAG: GTP-binding protein [Parcubacteria group bacterium Athens0714_12]
MKITKAEFIKGVVGDDYGMRDNLPQFSFFGRSNVGKSSVINSLVNRRDLARSSKIPGKTREANFFRVNDSFYFLDFPGYGYAKHSVKARNKMIKRIFWYIENSNSRPKAVFLIIDAKVGLTGLDREMIKILEKNNHQIIIIANKTDKLGKLAAEKQILSFQEELPQIVILPYSAKTKSGKDEVIGRIASFIQG